MSNILVSACLLGADCKYNGKNNRNENVLRLMEKHTLIPVCPEQLGGLATPREPSEKSGGRVISKSGADVTENYKKGADEVLKIARLYGGSGKVYDGTFSGTLIDGDGVTAQLLKQNGIEVQNENNELL